MSEVPDHLIDAAARAIKATMVSESSFASVTEEARAAILAVADELREEGARAERERIADEIEREARTDEEFDLAETFMLAARDGRRPDSHAWTQSLLRLARRVREGGDTNE